MNQKNGQSIYHANVNINLIVEKGIQIKSGIMINVDVSVDVYVSVDYIWKPATCCCKNGKYLGSIIDDSVISCDEIIEKIKTVPIKTVPTNFNEKKLTSKTKKFYILLTSLSTTIALSISVSIYCYLIKYQAKSKYWNHITTQITN